MSALVPVSSYASNPYVQNTIKNPFLDLPDTKDTYYFIKDSNNFKFYIPKIEDLFEIVVAGKIYTFRGMIESGMFDLKKVDPSGRTLMSTLERSRKKPMYINYLIDCRVNLTALAPTEFWMRGVSPELQDRIRESIKESSRIKQIEDFIVLSLRYQFPFSLSSMKKIFNKITDHFPVLNLERIINVAMSAPSLRPLVNHVVALGGNPDRSRNALSYSIAADGAPSSLTSRIIPARFPVTSLDTHLVDIPTKSAALKLDQASACGLYEHVFRSQLAGLFGLDLWPKTLDELPRPYSALKAEDISDYFDAIKEVRGFDSLDPIILTEKDLPVSLEKLALIHTVPTRPLIVTGGWKGHSAVIVIIGDVIYKGNRTPLDPLKSGVYSGRIDRSKLTAEMLGKIIGDENPPEWFSHQLEAELGGAPTTLLSLRKSQGHPNCTWSSCAEMSCYILQLHQGKTEEQAQDFVRQVRAKVRHSFLCSYLALDRTHEPFLHSAPLLGSILAKCLLRRNEKLPQYQACIDAIMASNLSVDMLQVIYNLDIKSNSKKKVIEYVTTFASELGISIKGLFRRLDPYYRVDEHKYKQVLKQQDSRFSILLDFSEYFDVSFWLNDPLIPTDYKVAIVKQLIPPFLALSLLAVSDHHALLNDFKTEEEVREMQLEPTVREALLEVIRKSGLTGESLIDRKHEISEIPYSDNVKLGEYIHAILLDQSLMAQQVLTNENAKKQKEFYEYIAFLLQDPIVGGMLTHGLLYSENLKKVKECYDAIGVFPDDILLRSKEGFLLALPDLLKLPGWELFSKKRVMMEFLAREPFKDQIEVLYKFFEALGNDNSEGSVQLIKELIFSLWNENPFLIQHLFSHYLKTYSIDMLYEYKEFSIIVDFLWVNDKSFIQALLRMNPQIVTIWPKKMRQIAYLHFPEDPVTKKVSFPPDIIDSFFGLELGEEDTLAFVEFLTENRVAGFNKTRAEKVESQEKPTRFKKRRTIY